ncbi:MAG: FtsX-like permease family protein [Thermoanaerobaculales bacterium]|jgi:putative ABC transport system permease protein|nr:FtsX-like permease family protein [Thermoanaerobaculales bacterium]
MILRALLLRPLLRRPWRFLVTVAGVATGVAAVISTVAASRAAIASFAEGVDEVAGAVRLEVTRPGGLPEELLADLRPVSGDALLVPVVEDTVLLMELGDGVRLLGVDLLLDAQVRPVLADSGALPDLETTLLGFGALVSRPLAATLGVTPGDHLTVSVGGRLRIVEVAEVFDADGLSAVWERVLIMDVAPAQEVLGRVGRLDRIELVPRAGADPGALRERTIELLPADVSVAEPGERRRFAEQMLASLRFNLIALSAISLLVAGVLIATTLATSVVQRRFVVSLLRSMGAARSKIAAVVLVEALGIGLIGGAIGVAAGFGGARLALTSVRFTVSSVVRGIPASEIRFDPQLAAVGLAMAVATALAASLLPLKEIMSVPPLQGLRSTAPQRMPRQARLAAVAVLLAMTALAVILVRAPAVNDLPIPALTAALVAMIGLLAASGLLLDTLARAGHLPFARLRVAALQLAAAALSAGRQRAAWAAGSVAVAIALAVAIATMVSSFRATVESWTESGMRADLWVRPMAADTGAWIGRLDPEVVTIAEDLFGAETVDPFYSETIEYRGRPVSFGAAAFDVVRFHGSVPFPGRDSAAVFDLAWRERAAVVNEPFATRFGIGEGDTVRLELPGGVLEREVVGVFRDYSRSHGLVVVDRTDFLRFFPDLGPDDMALFLPPETDPAAARERFFEATRGRFLVEALDNRELKGAVLSAFERTFAITTAMYLVTAVVAGVAIVTVLLTLVGERRRELATVRAIGGSRRQLLAMVVAEAGLLGVAAAAAGTLVGIAVGIILVKVVNLQSFGWSLELVLPWGSMAAMATWVVVTCLMAGLPPAAVAARMEPAIALREEV